MSEIRSELLRRALATELMEGTLRGGFSIGGFATLRVRTYKPFEGRDPRTGAIVHVAGKVVPFFTADAPLRDRVIAGSTARLPIDSPALVEALARRKPAS